MTSEEKPEQDKSGDVVYQGTRLPGWNDIQINFQVLPVPHGYNGKPVVLYTHTVVQ